MQEGVTWGAIAFFCGLPQVEVLLTPARREGLGGCCRLETTFTKEVGHVHHCSDIYGIGY